MKNKYAITLDKEMLTTKEIISIFQQQEDIEPLQSLDLNIVNDTLNHIKEKTDAININYNYYQNEITQMRFHSCGLECEFDFERDHFEEIYGVPCSLEAIFQEWGDFIISQMECKTEIVKFKCGEDNKIRIKESSEIFNISFERLKQILRVSPHKVVEVIQNIEFDDNKTLNKLPKHLGIQIRYKEESKELFIYYGEKHFPGLYRGLLLLEIFKLIGYKA
ncbi:TPA: hypothetical protein ACGX4N_004615 [Bacillus cereus]